MSDKLSRKEQIALRETKKLEQERIREKRKEEIRTEKLLSEMIKQKERRMLVEAAQAREAESIAASDAKYRSDKAAQRVRDVEIVSGIKSEIIDQDNRRANAANANANYNYNYNQNEAAAAAAVYDDDVDPDENSRLPYGIEYPTLSIAEYNQGFGNRKKSMKKRKTKKRVTKRRNRRYKNKSNKRI
jgi:hypothetical protein